MSPGREQKVDLAFAELSLAEAGHELYGIREAVRRAKQSGDEILPSTRERFGRLRDRIDAAEKACGYADESKARTEQGAA